MGGGWAEGGALSASEVRFMGLVSGGTGVEVGSGLGAEEEVWGSILGGVVEMGDGGGEEECRVGGGRLVGSDLGGGIG